MEIEQGRDGKAKSGNGGGAGRGKAKSGNGGGGVGGGGSGWAMKSENAVRCLSKASEAIGRRETKEREGEESKKAWGHEDKKNVSS